MIFTRVYKIIKDNGIRKYFTFIFLNMFMLCLTKSMNHVFIFGLTVWVLLFYHSLIILELLYNKTE